MSERHPFSELTKDFTPERRQRVDAMKRDLLAEAPSHQLRQARAFLPSFLRRQEPRR